MQALRSLRRRLKQTQVPHEHLPIVRGEQISAFKKALPFGVFATLLNACIIIGYSFLYGTAPLQNVWIWSIIMLGVLIVGAPETYKAYKSKKAVFPRPAKDLKKPLFSASMIGLAWALGLLLLMPDASGTQQLLLTTVCAGMMCGGAYICSTVPRAAVIFVATIALGFAASILMSPLGTGKFAMIMLLTCYSIVMFYAAFWNYHNHVRSWLQQLELNSQKAELGQQNEVINLLLKDFEQTASDCLWETDVEANLLRLNADLAERLNIPANTPMPQYFQKILVLGGASELQVAHIFNQARDQSFFRDYIIRIQTETGDRWLSFSGKRKESGGYRGVVADVTDVHEAMAKVSYLAHYDSLTGLANREQLKIELETAFKAQKERGEDFAMLCLDLDRFKVINDAHGHLVGDAVLTASAQRMRECLGEHDVAARVGGDEFTILQRADGSIEAAEALSIRLIEALEKPIIINELILQVSSSIGIALCPQHGDEAGTLLKKADLALYRAKQNGRAQLCTFQQDMDDEISHRRALEADMRRAIREGEFRLFFQPLIDGTTRQAVGFEALLRWQHPERGMVSPDEFISVAEKTGMISAIGEWVIREALKEAACWTDQQSVSINLSPLQVKSPNLMPCVVNALAATGVAPERLEFEITESVLLDESENTLKTLREFHNMGIRISLDDFGTGYSSLSYLSSFPFDKIKIDKSFVQAIGDSTECRAIVRAVAGLAGSLGIRSTAEGLETQEQINSVMAEGCSELQGFFFSKPQTAETLAKAGLLRRSSKPIPPLVALSVNTFDGSGKHQHKQAETPNTPGTDHEKTGS